MQNPNTEETLFEVTLQAEGAGHLLRLYKLTRWVFVTAVLFSVILTINTGISLRRLYTTNYRAENYYGIIYLWGSVASFLLTIAQVSCYFYFTRLAKRGIETRQTELFNRSFKWLYRNSMVSMVSICVQIITIAPYFLGVQ